MSQRSFDDGENLPKKIAELSAISARKSLGPPEKAATGSGAGAPDPPGGAQRRSLSGAPPQVGGIDPPAYTE